jgi:hypothetical protein
MAAAPEPPVSTTSTPAAVVAATSTWPLVRPVTASNSSRGSRPRSARGKIACVHQDLVGSQTPGQGLGIGQRVAEVIELDATGQSAPLGQGEYLALIIVRTAARFVVTS